jgi:hypothetical protein
MRSWQKTILAAAAVCAITSLPALALGRPPEVPGGGGPPRGGNGNGGINRGGPGPIAGAGLPFLLIAGGYVLVRRYRNRGKAE